MALAKGLLAEVDRDEHELELRTSVDVFGVFPIDDEFHDRAEGRSMLLFRFMELCCDADEILDAELFVKLLLELSSAIHQENTKKMGKILKFAHTKKPPKRSVNTMLLQFSGENCPRSFAYHQLWVNKSVLYHFLTTHHRHWPF